MIGGFFMRTIYRVMDALDDVIQILEYLEEQGNTVCRCRDDYECRYCLAKKVLRDANKIRHRGEVTQSKPRKDVICITTNRKFTTLVDAGKFYKVNPANISKCCKGQLQSAGRLSGEKLKWMYVEDFTNINNIEITD